MGAPAFDHFERVRDTSEGNFQRFSDTLWTAGKVHDQATVADADHRSTEHGKRGNLQRLHTHGLGDAGNLQVDDLTCRFWRHITGAKSCASCGHHQVNIAGVAPLGQPSSNEACFIGDDLAGYFFKPPSVRHDLADGVAAGVFAFALRTCIADCENCQLENLPAPQFKIGYINVEEEFPNIPCAVAEHSGTLIAMVGKRLLGARPQRVNEPALDAAGRHPLRIRFIRSSTDMLPCRDEDHILKRTIVGPSAHSECLTRAQSTFGQQSRAAVLDTPQSRHDRPNILASSAAVEQMTKVNEPAISPIHVPVMSTEAIEGLGLTPGGAYIDCNVGEGGHADAIFRAGDDVSVLGIDLDDTALNFARLRLADYTDRLELAQSNFSELAHIAGGGLFEGVLFDLGVSSLQLDTPERGFSFRNEAALDMRFNPQTELTAYDIVNHYQERELAAVIREYGEEPRARSIARAIISRRRITTTTELADVVKRAVNWSTRSRVHPATRTFQALRIAVNGELDNLEKGLMAAIQALRPNGRLVVLSYHSLEDRVVKNVMRREASECICPPGLPICVCKHTPTLSLINRRVITPSDEEIRSNPRARSAKLRIAQRI